MALTIAAGSENAEAKAADGSPDGGFWPSVAK
jgi:hypothetical protein